MRLPWQKVDDFATPSSPKSKKVNGLKSMLAGKANQSTGSYMIEENHSLSQDSLRSSDEKLKSKKSTSKKKKSGDDNSQGSSSDDLPSARKESNDDLKKKKSSNNDFLFPTSSRKSLDAGVPRARRGSITGLSSPLAAELSASNSSLSSPSAPRKSLDAGVPIARRGSITGIAPQVAAVVAAASPIPILTDSPKSSPKVKAKKDKDREVKKKTKKKDAGPKPPKIGKDGRMKKSVSFTMYDELPMPDGSTVIRHTNTHEPTKSEVPYHKRGKMEYKEKKRKEKEQRKLTGDESGTGESDDESSSEEDELFVVPVLQVLNSSDEALNKQPGNEPHALHFNGRMPQRVDANLKTKITLKSVALAKYAPDIKGMILIDGAHHILENTRDMELKVKIRYLFDDWDSKAEILAERMDPGVLSLALGIEQVASPIASPTTSSDTVNESGSTVLGPVIPETVGFRFTIPVYKTFLPSLYAMLQQMGMDTNQATFQVDGVVVFLVYVYRTKIVPKIESAEPESGSATASSSSLTSPPHSANSSTTLPLGTLGEIKDALPLTISDASKSLDQIAVAKKKAESVKSKSRSSQLDLEDQLVFTLRFEVNFDVEKNAKGCVQSADLLHVGYQTK